MAYSAARNILLGGGTGFVGSYLKQAFERNGFSVIVVSRNSGLGRITWNELQRDGLPSNVVYVVNTAGENVLNPFKRWTEAFKKEVVCSRVRTNEILRNIVNEADRKPDALLSLSGVGIYGPDRNKLYDEKSNVLPFDFFSKLVQQWENAIENTHGVRKIVIRSGVVLGRTGGMIKQIFLPFYLGLGGPMGCGMQYFPWIHIEDLTRIILYSLQNKSIAGVVNAVAPEIVSNQQFSQAFAKSLNRPAFFPVPSWVVRVVFGHERASMVFEGQKVRPTKLLDDPNFEFLFPAINDAVRDITKQVETSSA